MENKKFSNYDKFEGSGPSKKRKSVTPRAGVQGDRPSPNGVTGGGGVCDFPNIDGKFPPKQSILHKIASKILSLLNLCKDGIEDAYLSLYNNRKPRYAKLSKFATLFCKKHFWSCPSPKNFAELRLCSFPKNVHYPYILIFYEKNETQIMQNRLNLGILGPNHHETYYNQQKCYNGMRFGRFNRSKLKFEY